MWKVQGSGWNVESQVAPVLKLCESRSSLKLSASSAPPPDNFLKQVGFERFWNLSLTSHFHCLIMIKKTEQQTKHSKYKTSSKGSWTDAGINNTLYEAIKPCQISDSIWYLNFAKKWFNSMYWIYSIQYCLPKNKFKLKHSCDSNRKIIQFN